jgi:release factor glutamine methyltransferase
VIVKIIKAAEERLIKHDIPENYAKYVMNELLLEQGRNLYLEMNEEIDETTLNKFNSIMDKLCEDMPLAYAMGVQYFYGYPIEVNSDVLIPRYETEELVLNVIQEIDEHFDDQAITVLDVGTGSGAIACALKAECPQIHMFASDISEDALKQAQRNADNIKVKVDFYQGDMLQPFIDHSIKADVIVCNPPYIPSGEEIQNSVKAYEPHLALFGGEDGLKFYRSVLSNAHYVLNEKNILAFEMGWNQGQTLTDLARSYFPMAKIDVIKDMQGKDRILIVRNLGY